MVLKSGKSDKTVAANIRELHGGKTYAKTKAKSGKSRADAQAIAIAMHEAGRSKAKPRRKTLMEH